MKLSDIHKALALRQNMDDIRTLIQKVNFESMAAITFHASSSLNLSTDADLRKKVREALLEALDTRFVDSRKQLLSLGIDPDE